MIMYKGTFVDWFTTSSSDYSDLKYTPSVEGHILWNLHCQDMELHNGGLQGASQDLVSIYKFLYIIRVRLYFWMGLAVECLTLCDRLQNIFIWDLVKKEIEVVLICIWSDCVNLLQRRIVVYRVIWKSEWDQWKLFSSLHFIMYSEHSCCISVNWWKNFC